MEKIRKIVRKAICESAIFESVRDDEEMVRLSVGFDDSNKKVWYIEAMNWQDLDKTRRFMEKFKSSIRYPQTASIEVPRQDWEKGLIRHLNLWDYLKELNHSEDSAQKFKEQLEQKRPIRITIDEFPEYNEEESTLYYTIVLYPKNLDFQQSLRIAEELVRKKWADYKFAATIRDRSTGVNPGILLGDAYSNENGNYFDFSGDAIEDSVSKIVRKDKSSVWALMQKFKEENLEKWVIYEIDENSLESVESESGAD